MRIRVFARKAPCSDALHSRVKELEIKSVGRYWSLFEPLQKVYIGRVVHIFSSLLLAH